MVANLLSYKCVSCARSFWVAPDAFHCHGKGYVAIRTVPLIMMPWADRLRSLRRN